MLLDLIEDFLDFSKTLFRVSNEFRPTNDSSNGDFFSGLYLCLEDYEGEIQNAVKDAVRVALEVGILTSLS